MPGSVEEVEPLGKMDYEGYKTFKRGSKLFILIPAAVVGAAVI